MIVTRAVIAAGGIGSKMLPMTRALPKEMFPIRDRPILEHIVTELRDAGIERVLFVINDRKTMIADYFGSGSRWGMEFTYRCQDLGDGPGMPILLAQSWIGDDPFVYAFGDNLIIPAPGRPSPLRRLLADHSAHPDHWALLAEIRSPHNLPRNETVLGPINHPAGFAHPHTHQAADATPDAELVVCAARWVFTPAIVAAQRACPRRRTTGELYLVDAVQRAVHDGQPLRVVPVAADGERRYNLDIWPTYHACAAEQARPKLTAGLQ